MKPLYCRFIEGKALAMKSSLAVVLVVSHLRHCRKDRQHFLNRLKNFRDVRQWSCSTLSPLG